MSTCADGSSLTLDAAADATTCGTADQGKRPASRHPASAAWMIVILLMGAAILSAVTWIGNLKPDLDAQFFQILSTNVFGENHLALVCSDFWSSLSVPDSRLLMSVESMDRRILVAIVGFQLLLLILERRSSLTEAFRASAAAFLLLGLLHYFAYHVYLHTWVIDRPEPDFFCFDAMDHQREGLLLATLLAMLFAVAGLIEYSARFRWPATQLRNAYPVVTALALAALFFVNVVWHRLHW